MSKRRRFHFHEWSKWYDVGFYAIRQEKICHKCNKRKMRLL